jgi:exodeoxyribonuclease V alpha subunit
VPGRDTYTFRFRNWSGRAPLSSPSLLVEFAGAAEGPVAYDRPELDELVLSYAITVHKSQGSEYPAVVLPLLTQHYLMLQRDLLYTAVTRARRQVTLIGSPKAIALAVRNNRREGRFTRLAERLCQGEAPSSASPSTLLSFS